MHGNLRSILLVLVVVLSPIVTMGQETAAATAEESIQPWKEAFLFSQARDAGEESGAREILHREECIGGSAGGYPCERVDLLEFMPLSTIGGGGGNDLWGWTDPVTGTEYALMGRTTGLAFVDLSDPEEPVYIGNLPTQTNNSTWRDVKTRGDYAFIVSEASGHGMQVFDLTQLRSVTTPPVTFTATAHYDEFGNAHNIVVNEDSGFAYAVGTDTCSAGLHMIDISDPLDPSNAGCFSADGYTHDAQCVNYIGPDADYAGSEVCFNSNTDTLTIVDVTTKASPVQISRTGYTGVGYTHQGWLTDDHRYFLMNDELDELNFGHNTKTYIWDLEDLDNPFVLGAFVSSLPASDHNLYVHNGYVYEANYKAGLRILSLNDIANGNLTEVAYFDTFPSSNSNGTSGAWSVYPYFASGVVIVSGIGEGLFVVQPVLCSDPAAPEALVATPAGDNTISLSWTSSAPPEATFDIYRAFGSCLSPQGEQKIAAGVSGTTYVDTSASGSVEYAYTVRASVEAGLCISAPSNCFSATTTGACNAPPIFDGLESVTNQASASCALDLGWSSATPNCGPSTTYSVYRSLVSGFDPVPGNQVANGVTSTTFEDTGMQSGVDYFYVVRAKDSGNSVEDGNLVEVAGRATGPLADGSYGLGAEVGEPGVEYGSGASATGPQPDHLGWEFSSDRVNTGSRSYFSTYFDGQCLWFATEPLNLSAGETSVLSFSTVYDIESRYDGGVVQISTDGGGSWSTLAIDQGYPGTFRSSADACGFATNDPSFTDTNLTWTEYTADLSAYSGSEIRIRWIFSTDGAATREGWYVDDIDISHVEVPGSCEAALFTDGFESGDTTGWSSTVF